MSPRKGRQLGALSIAFGLILLFGAISFFNHHSLHTTNNGVESSGTTTKLRSLKTSGKVIDRTQPKSQGAGSGSVSSSSGSGGSNSDSSSTSDLSRPLSSDLKGWLQSALSKAHDSLSQQLDELERLHGNGNTSSSKSSRSPPTKSKEPTTTVAATVATIPIRATVVTKEHQATDQWLDAVVSNAHQSHVTPQPVALTFTDKTAPTKTQTPAPHQDHGNQITQLFRTLPSAGSSKLHAVTYASHGGRDDRFCRAVESAIRSGVDLVILGWEVEWRGLSQKLEAAHSYAKSLPETDIILFTDAFDVLFADSGASIRSKFLQLATSLNSRIIFSAECGCWPHIIDDMAIIRSGRGGNKTCFDTYPRSPTPYRYLNSGTWIGFAKESADMLAQVIVEAGKEFGNANDQKLVADMYMDGRHGIKLDFFNVLFQSMHMTSTPLPDCNPQFDVELTPDGTWFNKRTNAHPAVFHFNGGGKAHHLEMEGKVWYKRPDENTPEKRRALGAHLLSVPTAVGTGGKLRFDKMCRTYI